MNQISKLIEQRKINSEEERKDFFRKRIYLKIDIKEFKELFLVEANRLIAKKNPKNTFQFTEHNKPVITQLYYYCTMSEKFEYDLSKGIMLAGTHGIGKTLILKTVCEIVALFGRNIKYYHVKKLQSEILKNGYSEFEKKPLFIDDLGKESREVNDYGTKMLPLADLLALRYDSNSITLTTTNYKLETLKGFYGDSVADRLKEMFNIIIVEGKSFRK